MSEVRLPLAAKFGALLQSLYAVPAVAMGLLGGLFVKSTDGASSSSIRPAAYGFCLFVCAALVPFGGAVLLWLGRRLGWWITVVFDTLIVVFSAYMVYWFVRCHPSHTGDVLTVLVVTLLYFCPTLALLLAPSSRNAFLSPPQFSSTSS